MTSRAKQWISRSLTGVLLLLALWFLWLAVLPVFSGSDESTDITADGSITPGTATVSVGSLARGSLADRHLFGESEESNPPGFDEIKPVTDLALILRGVVAAEDPQTGMAIISDGRSREAVYAVGAELPGGASLEAVLPDRAILRRNGRQETLMLEGAGRSVAGESRLRSLQKSDAANVSATVPTMAMPLTSNVPGARGFAINIRELAASYNLIPAPGGGFRINIGRDADALVTAGLHQGDIIRAANGASLDNPALVQQVLAEVLLGKPLSLTVERGGETITVKPDLDALGRQ